MNVYHYALIAILMTFASISVAAAGEDIRARMATAGLDNPNEVKDFLNELQTAIRARDAKAISEMVHYPIKVVTAKRGPLRIHSASELIKLFNVIFDKDTSAVILCQQFDDIGANTYGVAIGDGVVWIGLVHVEKALARITPADLQRDIASRNDRQKWQLKITGIFGKYARDDVKKICPRNWNESLSP